MPKWKYLNTDSVFLFVFVNANFNLDSYQSAFLLFLPFFFNREEDMRELGYHLVLGL